MNPKIDYNVFPNRHILCIDMKSFYASCAALAKGLNPLTARLAVVADLNRRGSVVLAASPKLKKEYGIRTGSRLFEIPDDDQIIVVSAQMNLYLQVSTEISRLFNKYVPKEAIHTYSVDESFLEIDGTNRLWGDPEEVATLIKEEIKDTFGLTSAIGIGPNMLLAKLCLDLESKNKRSQIARWSYMDVSQKLWNLAPLSRMWGIGNRLEKRLNRMGISTIGQLANYPLERLQKTFGIMGEQLFYHANGIDLSELGAPILNGQISYGKSQILLKDYHNSEDISYVILEMCEEIGKRARHNYKVGRTISLGIGYSETEGGGGFYRSCTLIAPTNITMEIFQTCMHLFEKFFIHKTVRKITVTLSNIREDRTVQLQLFQENRARERQLGYTMDSVRDKYGQDVLLRAVSFTSAGTALKRSKLVGGHYAE